MQFRASEGDAGQRLDKWLTAKIGGVSRARVQDLIRRGFVRASTPSLRPNAKVSAGLTVDVTFPAAEPAAPRPEPIALDILFEDSTMIAIDKPPGMVVHPAPGHAGGTVVNALLHHCRDLAGIGGERRPGIVHRLDKDTSGVLVAAKTDAAMLSLADQFRRRRVHKQYVTLVHGVPPREGTIEAPIGRSRRDRKKMTARPVRGRAAVTTYACVEAYGEAALLRLVIGTGRTHQIRVHMAHIGHPVIGDRQYGRPATDRALGLNVERQMLHAESIGLAHPGTGAEVNIEAPWPEDFRLAVEALRARLAGGGADDA